MNINKEKQQTMFSRGLCSKISDSFQIQRNFIVVTVSLLIMDQTEFRLVHSKKKILTTSVFLSIWKETKI